MEQQQPRPNSNHGASCHCGRVAITIAHKPDYMNDCNCSLCVNTAVSARKVGTGFLPADTPKHKSAVWGYYAAADVEVVGETRGYSRSDYPDPAVRIHSCGACGVTTHWTLTEDFAAKHPEEAGRMGVNMRLFDDAAKAGVELRFPDGAAWDGEGEYGYVRDAVVVPEQ